MPRYFTLEEAQRTLVDIIPVFRRALSLRVEMREAEQQLQDISRQVILSGGMMLDREHVGGIRRTRDQAVERLRAIIDTIQETGCIIKDLDAGLLDFPTLYKDREVYLCWRADEDGIAYWHPIDEGFRGRKPIDEEFLQNHRGGDE
jgi:hypothetical protein